jgi:hypothetical protein
MDWLESKRILHIHGDRPGDFEFSPRGMSLRAAIDLELEGLDAARSSGESPMSPEAP